MLELLAKYFPELSPAQQTQFAALPTLYAEWNEKINLISRKDIQHLPLRHVLHSLAFAKYVPFKAGSQILDLGTGGGFPGIPLAIVFPEVHFTLIDGRGKKITAVKGVAQAIGLKNVEARHQRAEELKRPQFDFVVSRAVAPLPRLFSWSHRLLRKQQRNPIPNGLITLKGGQLQAEIEELPKKAYSEITPVRDFFEEEWFEEKYIVYVS